MKQIFILINGAQQGPYEITVLGKMLIAQEINTKTLCWFEGATDWFPIATAFPALASATPPPGPPISPNASTTQQSVATTFQIASVGERFLAGILDFVILAIIAAVFSFLMVFGGVLLGAIYVIVTMCNSQLQGTLGMKIMKIKIVDGQGNTLTPSTSIIRYLMSAVSLLIFMLGYIMIFFTTKNQTLHDLVAATIVVRR